ncbi:hypothetical protein SEPCBS57363_003036 [Sporothrix epigloea]|uniref:DUF3835 domain-containing protein n=1 Tax=Sporothrix epigloea TaxID=1892477 RepID=A0ABP0DJ87_9PEZI
MSQPPFQTTALSQVRNLLADLQNRTAQLDAQVSQLSKALDHWRLLGAEYEALANEIHQARTRSLEDDTKALQAQQDALVRIRRDFDGQLVDQETVCDLFGARVGQTITRSIDHIAGAVGRRLDYVNQNIQTLEKKVKAVMDKLSALEMGSLTALLNEDSSDSHEKGIEEDGCDEGPVTDIVEQLDDNDNVVDVQLHTPSQTQSRVLDALNKAGIKELPADNLLEARNNGESAHGKKMLQASEEEQPSEMAKESKDAARLRPNAGPSSQRAAHKGVSFSKDTKAGDYGESLSSPASSSPQSFAAQRLANIIQSAKQQESAVDASSYIYPEGEADDDAALRREMLEYSRSEIGPIVAQLDIEEELSDVDEGYDDDFYDDDEFDEDDDNEDESGRSKYSVIDDAYRERMRELERALGVQSLETATAQPPAAVRNDIAKSLGRIRVSGKDDALASSDAKAVDDQELLQKTNLTSVLKEPTENFRTRVKTSDDDNKKVSFAKFVDVAPQSTEATPGLSVSAGGPPPAVTKPVVNLLCDVVVERSDNSQESTGLKPDATAKSKRVSRFKKARSEGTEADLHGLPRGPHQAPVRFLDQDRTVAPEGPTGKTHAEEVVERQAVTEPREPHDLDAGILMQEAAAQYHRTRNRMIQQQGGFLKASETAVVPISQEDGGRRISKFKAARLGNQFMTPP